MTPLMADVRAARGDLWPFTGLLTQTPSVKWSCIAAFQPKTTIDSKSPCKCLVVEWMFRNCRTQQSRPAQKERVRVLAHNFSPAVFPVRSCKLRLATSHLQTHVWVCKLRLKHVEEAFANYGQISIVWCWVGQVMSAWSTVCRSKSERSCFD